MSVAAIILAAGQGTRFGAEPKLLADLAGKPLVRHVAEAAVRSSARPVVVVTGHRGAQVRDALADLPVETIANARYGDGLSTSLKAGFAALPATTEAAIILLGDMPLVGAGLIDALIGGWTKSACPPALVPVHGGRRGNPVVLSLSLRPQIDALEGDSGAGPLLRTIAGIVEWPVEDASVLQDIDTVAALAGLSRPPR